MLRASRHIGAALVALQCLLGTKAGAEQVTLSPSELRALTAQRLSVGDPARALAMADALIGRDATDIEAWILKSRAARDLGRHEDARHAARRVMALAETDQHRYIAALAMAQALASEGRRTAAQIWLRRAGQVAPTDLDRARARDDFRYVQSRNRWSTSLSFNIAPTSNLNNGSSQEKVELLGLPLEFTLNGAARALSGTEISGGISTRYRLNQSPTHRSYLGASLFHRTYTLSSEAKSIAPDAKGSDFALTNVTLSYAENHVRPEAGLGLGWSARLTHTVYGGEALYSGLSLSGYAQQRLNRNNALKFDLSHDWQKGAGARDDAGILSGAAHWTTRLGPTSRMTLTLGGTRSTSDASYLDYADARIGARFDLGAPVLNTGLAFGLTANRRHYDATRFAPGARDDTSVAADVTMVFNGIDYMGFVPTVTLEARRTQSNVNLYDAEEFGVKLGIRSSF